MPLQQGQSLAHYRLVEKIGQGGMGVVWRAEDTRLGRHVAIKALPPEVAGDPQRLARFQREAQLLASLNHPNIAAIHGLEESGGQPFLVLELVEGEDLAERLLRGPLPVDEALDVASQMAEGLQAAHEKGIVHRDLKPANVKLAPGGKVKILDFGLAKAWAGEAGGGAAPDLSQSPTLAHPATQAGIIMGTAAYMSPEQARGRPVDKRSDIWSFGVVLFQMLTGKPVFTGETVSDVLAAVLTKEPPAGELPPGLPGGVHRLLRRCLARDPGARYHDIADARLEILESRDEPEPGAGREGSPATSRSLAVLAFPWAVAVAALMATLWAWLARPAGESPKPTAMVVSSLLPPEGMGFDLDYGLALSPDGTRLVFPARDESGLGRLFLRALDHPDPLPLQGTEQGVAPFWSPDGTQIAFFTEESLRKLNLETGVVETLAGVSSRTGGTWGSRGDIVFSGRRGGLHRVDASGGPVEQVTRVERAGTDDHLWPSFLPDGVHFLFHLRRYAADGRTGRIMLGSLEGGPAKDLFPANSGAVYAHPGYLVWWEQGNLRAQRFDTGTLSLQGEPDSLLSGVRFDPRIASAAFSISRTGTLVYQSGGALSGNRLAWLDRNGTELASVGPSGSLYDPTLSPDGSLIAVDISDETNQGDLWVVDARRGRSNRLTAGAEDESCPVWSPDGKSIAYCSVVDESRFGLYLRPSAGGGEGRLVAEDPARNINPIDWQGQSILVSLSDRGTDRSNDIGAVSVKDGTVARVADSPFQEVGPAFSPGGRFVAYASDETGRFEIYVQPFPGPGRAWRVSVDGGMMPRFHPDMSEIFFVSLRKEMMSAAITPSGDGLEFGEPRPLFRADMKVDFTAQWDTADGERFLVNLHVRAGATDPLTLIQGWDATLPR